MKYNLNHYILIFCILLSACGGGGNSNVSEPPDPSETKVTLQITTTDLQVSASKGDVLPVSFEGRWSAINLGSNLVYIQAYDLNNNSISSTTLDVSNSESFKLETFINHTLPIGEYASTISFLACKDIECNNKYENADVDLNIKLSIKPVPQWQTHQANAYHNGYVPIWVDTTNFDKLWTWSRSESSEPIGGINAPVAGNGEVYVSTDVYFGDGVVFSLDELTGDENWRVSFGNVPALNPPAINDDTLFVATSGHEDTKVWGISRGDGKLKFQSNFTSQWGNYLAPTVYDDLVFQTGGYYGGLTFAFSVETGEKVWSKAPGSSWGMDTPTVDDKHVYVHNGNTLTIFNKKNGEIEKTISDPFGNSNYDYHGAPVKGSKNNILAFSGGAFSGSSSSNTEHFGDRVISNFDVITGEYKWSSQYAYRTFFAVSNNVAYAGKNDPVSLDAIDETTGDVLWSWVAPTIDDKEFHRNIVVTKNLLFVSTNAHLYAIDLESREVVWSYDEPGMIAISDNRILLLSPGYRESDGRLIAFDLRSK